MKYQINTKYVWYKEGQQIILLYCIQNVPFTWDEMPEIAKQNKQILEMANSEKGWEPEDLYRAAMYLNAEECNPLVFELEFVTVEIVSIILQSLIGIDTEKLFTLAANHNFISRLADRTT